METGREITYHGTRTRKYMHHKTRISVPDSIYGKEKEIKNDRGMGIVETVLVFHYPHYLCGEKGGILCLKKYHWQE